MFPLIKSSEGATEGIFNLPFSRLHHRQLPASGGYEARKQLFQRRFSIDLVKCAVEATYELPDELYPEKEPEFNT